MTLSGWCSPAHGCRHTHAEHTACTSPRCQCEAFGGHETVVETGLSAAAACDNGGTNQDGPGGASTPLLRGLPINNLESR